ncbi:phenylalanine ammonia-lyase [Puccinia sorghi]|uniref:Phenylalanine ammonia-lyase n=1 Tax=Puccinia sorghi TaxID=27349 RepID=A0A0L6UZJ2_9BASI|nr:phenylalanine ammonia-lyase [Puccinia sorghi]
MELSGGIKINSIQKQSFFLADFENANSIKNISLVMASIGKIMFEMVKKLKNSPSTKYNTLETACAAYFPYIQYLVGPVTTHLQSSNVHNKSINSSNFIITRQTLREIEILKIHIYCLCQALDLRVFDLRLSKNVMPIIYWFWSCQEATAGLDIEEQVHDGFEFMVLVIVEAFKLDKRKISGAWWRYSSACWQS